MVVLGQIKSEDGKFPTFVHRRVTDVRQASDSEQWRYVPTNLNPADIATRGATELDMWLNAPLYLLSNSDTWPESPCSSSVIIAVSEEPEKRNNNMAAESHDQQQPGQVNGENMYDKSHDSRQEDGCQETVSPPHEGAVSSLAATTEEVRKHMGCSTTDFSQFTSSPTDVFIHSFSGWFKLRRALVWYVKFIRWRIDKNDVQHEVSVADMHMAERNLIRYAQKVSYSKEYDTLRSGRALPRKNQLYYLEPTLDADSLMRVGGRLKYADIDPDAKQQVLLPRDHHLTELIVRHAHVVKCLHSGVEHVLAVLRAEYWVPRARPLLRRIMKSCTVCRRLNARAYQQRMADLPPQRLAAFERPFTHVGIDCFGPILVHRGRGTVKRYGLIFTC